MSTLTTLIDGVYILRDGEKEYRLLAHFTMDMEADFQRSVLAEEVVLLERVKSLYTEEEYSQARALILARYRNGEYSFMSKTGAQFIKSHKGMMRILALLCPGHTQGEITAMLTLEQTPTLIKTILDESFGLEETKKNLKRRGLMKEEEEQEQETPSETPPTPLF